MHIDLQDQAAPVGVTPLPPPALRVVLRHARRLHRHAVSASLTRSLPVLRRVISTDTLSGLSLPELHRRRKTLQRKHLLRTLAVEAGFANWEAYRPALAAMSTSELQHFDIADRTAGYPNHWFSSAEEAQAHVDVHGGRMMRLGQQAVVLAE